MAMVNRQFSSDSQSWLGAVDVGYLTEDERDSILAVLWRDEKIRMAEQARISKLKRELRDVRRKGAKCAEGSYSNRLCARCNNKTGLVFNSSMQCPVCKHKVCQDCRKTGLFSQSWKCVVCYKETQLKASTGEWFYGMMRPELRNMQEGTTVVKQAVTTKSIHFDERSSSESLPGTPRKTHTRASSNSHISSKKDFSSADTEGTGSSTESRKHRDRRGQPGPAETGSIKSLRLRTSPRENRHPDHDEPSRPASANSRHSYPSRGPTKPPRMLGVADEVTFVKKEKSRKEQQNHHFQYEDINTEPQLRIPVPAVRSKQRSVNSDLDKDDQVSVSSADSKSIDGIFEEYYQNQKAEEQARNSIGGEQVERERGESSYRSYNDDIYDGEPHNVRDRDHFSDENDDRLSQLPQPTHNLSRKLNEKLLRQNNLSASVPAIYSPKKKNRASMIDTQAAEDNSVSDYPLHKELSTSTPNLMKSTMSLNSAHLHDLSITGEIRFSLKFNYKTNILLVNVVDCRNLATADRRRKRSDPYVKCYLLPDRKKKQKTEVKKRTICPTYNKCLKFSVGHSELSTRVLELSVWHAGTFTRNLFLGQVQLPLDTWDWGISNQNWFPLRQRETISAEFVKGTVYKGDLYVALRYVPASLLTPGKRKAPHGELHVLIKQAKNLTPVRSNGTVDGYVKVTLQPDKQFRQKTSVIPKSSSPEWNANIRMQLYQPMEECGLQLSVWHRDKLQGSTFLGGCRLNMGQASSDGSQKWLDATGMEIGLWKTAISRPDSWVDGALSLRPNM